MATDLWQLNSLTSAEHKPSSGGAVDLSVAFTYDVLNNRIEKSVTAGSTTTTKFAYDQAGNAYVDFTGSSTIVGRHVFGDGTDALIANIVGGNTKWYLQDILGSTRDLTGSTGSLIDHLDYSPFGKLTYESASGSDRYLYTAREYDVELDLQYNRARYYDANAGRWISQDPLGFDAGDSNLYRYVNNRPTGATDPSGLQGLPTREEMQYGTDGKWPAGYYGELFLNTQLYRPYDTRPANTRLLELRRGCIGLCNLRLGLPELDTPDRHAIKTFTKYSKAEEFKHSLDKESPNKEFRIFAVHCNDFSLVSVVKYFKNKASEEEINKNPNKYMDLFYKSVDEVEGPVRSSTPFDYCTLHQPKSDQSTWFWESMSVAFSATENEFKNRTRKRPDPDVIHRPFATLVEKPGNYKYAFYCVVEVKKVAVWTPPAVKGGK